MQSVEANNESKDSGKRIQNRNLTQSDPITPKKYLGEDFTFCRSPIKTPKSVNKSIEIVKSRIGETIKEDETRQEKHNHKLNSEILPRLEDSFFQINKPKKDISEELAPKQEILFGLNENEEAKKKKDWKSWSLQEKELFYEAIAYGGNYSSLQKLFRNMNDVFFYFTFRK